MKGYYYDKLLNIHTGGKGTPNQNSHDYPYEPTPYEALEALFAQYEVSRDDYFVDYGCGLGRLNFYIHYFYHASVTGVELNEIFYRKAIRNKERYAQKTKQSVQRIKFINCRAEDYPISSRDNRFYFFNPFSVYIFQRIINRMVLSAEAFPREIQLILFYPSQEYINYLESTTIFELIKEVIVPNFYEKDENERFLIYQLKN